jgi:hypothetical protein
MHKWRILRLVLCAPSTKVKPTAINEHRLTLNFFRNNRCLARFTNGKCISEEFYLGFYVLWVPKWSPRQSPIRPTAGMWVGFYASLMDLGVHLCFTNGKCISEAFYLGFYVLWVPRTSPRQSPIRPTAGMWVGFYASLMDLGVHLCFTNGKCISEEFYVRFYVLRVPKWIPQGATSVEESARTDANNNYKQLIIEEQPQLSWFVLLQECE